MVQTTQNILLWFFSIAVAVVSLRFLVLDIETSMPHMVQHLDGRSLALFAHICIAPLVLAIVPFQFSTRIRSARPRLHRWMGRCYGLGILISGVAGFSLAIGTNAGPVASAGFAALAVLWIAVTARAIWLATQRRIAEHQLWMIRSAALTLAAVTLRLYLPFLVMGFGFQTGYMIVAWACWVPNVIAAEWIIRRRAVRAAA